MGGARSGARTGRGDPPVVAPFPGSVGSAGERGPGLVEERGQARGPAPTGDRNLMLINMCLTMSPREKGARVEGTRREAGIVRPESSCSSRK